ncbi:glucosamine-6-phosphate deaminase [Verrucomicrobium sp. GAS474]|uniref:glucosamine-6-phosphate deaminase n=1 Tax=Verrucomicrobium sp. GAS474 TaxID=1882831 RepID=UPI0008792DDE|nr:glucosamine-6-phosphate deaminase [Verrucomicrobium sp. GAS474]SDT86979.1 glucosamine-6-phosphate deaminase [Verrucomicrobium sp. GAS474]
MKIKPDSIVDFRFEKMPFRIFPGAAEASAAAAQEIAGLIRAREEEGRPCVLGLATGSTPVGVYRELIRLHKEEGLSFANVITFNLDEYYPMGPENPQSYRAFMEEHFFSHVDIVPANTHVPSGTVSMEEVPAACAAFDKAIEQAGGLDLQILGIGRTGHIGFNEPGSLRRSRTRLISLDPLTRLDAASNFGGLQAVPRRAITMGIRTILGARRVLLLAFGEHKAPIIREALEGEMRAEVPSTFLQEHDDVLVLLDPAAASDLTRVRTPWVVDASSEGKDGMLEWDDRLVCQAVVWLARERNKAILKLTGDDYNAGGLRDLVAQPRYGSAYEINRKVFYRLQDTITGWPGGKPPERIEREGQSPPLRGSGSQGQRFPKKIVVFSPHPDDDVISMGGTVIRLVEQGHDVHIAYHVSGSNAVSDEALQRHMEFVRDTLTESGAILPAGVDEPANARRLKALIRKSEARASARRCGVPMENLHFLEMPFYETGLVQRAPLGGEDVALLVALLEEIKPDQLYAAGDLADPHGTHRMCLEGVRKALAQCAAAGSPWVAGCGKWLYRGAWAAWPIHQVAMAVPLSPDEVVRKRQAIFKHETQKDQALFMGADTREFWQRAEERTRAAAEDYNFLGLPEYEAVETFAAWA